MARVEIDFAKICKEIANGSPMLTSIMTGKGFGNLKHNEIYKPPRISSIVEGKSAGLHVITLFGGGMRVSRKMYYKFVNTYGDAFCPLNNLIRKDGIKGGFGNVIAEGIMIRPVKFFRKGQGVPGYSNLNRPLKPDERTYTESESMGGCIQRSAGKFRQQCIVSDQGKKSW